MVSVIKEICIFMIIAQAVLFFVPSGSYLKYVRVLVGVLMIMWITEPILSLVFDDARRQELLDSVADFEKGLSESSKGMEIEDSGIDIYGSIEEELKNRLKGCESDYEVVEVRFAENVYGEKGDGGSSEKNGKEEIIITVSEKSADTGREIKIEPVKLGGQVSGQFGQEEDLKEIYGDCIGVDSERIKIVLE